VRYRFRKDCKLVSPSQIANGLKTGASLLDQLQACKAGSSTALAQLPDLLESTLSLASSTNAYRTELGPTSSEVARNKLPKIAFIQANANKANHIRQPGVKSILARPLPLDEIPNQRRKIPFLVAAHGIPFLRYGKPQSIGFGRYLRQQRASDAKKWEQKNAIEVTKVLAESEEEWDRILEDHHGVCDGVVQSGHAGAEMVSQRGFTQTRRSTIDSSWSQPLWESDQMLYEQLKARTIKRAAMGKKLWQIVLEERELARQEKIQRRIDRKTQAAQKRAETARKS
jgi:hypothetical protein